MNLYIVKYRALFNRKKNLNKEGKAPIEIECLLKRKRKFISTRIFISPAEWTVTKNRCYINHKNEHANALNQRIDQVISDLKTFELKQSAKHGSFDLNDLDGLTKEKFTPSFTDFFQAEMDSNRKLKPNTKRTHNKTLQKIKAFKTQVLFKDINYTWVKKFDNFLIEEYELAPNSIWAEHKNVKVYLNLAIKKGVIEKEGNPYDKFSVPRVETKREYLTDLDISNIEKLELPNESYLNTIRDFLLLSYYTGLRYSDMVNIGPKNITHTSDGMILTLVMEKTTTPIQIALHAFFPIEGEQSKPEQIICKYMEWGTLNGTFFKHLSNQHLNREYKTIANLAGIGIKLTCHVPRHSFAIAMTGKRLQLPVLQKLMGHKDIKTTMVYQKFTPEFITDQVKNVKW